MIDYSLIRCKQDIELFLRLAKILSLIDKPILNLPELISYHNELTNTDGFGNINLLHYLFTKNNPDWESQMSDYNYILSKMDDLIDIYDDIYDDYFVNLELNLILPLEKLFFRNEDKILYHAAPLLNLEFILKKGQILIDASMEKDKFIFFSERFYYALSVAALHQCMNKRNPYGTHLKKFVYGNCIIVPDLKNYDVYKKIFYNIDNDRSFFYTKACTKELVLDKSDVEYISSLKEKGEAAGHEVNIIDDNPEMFIKENLPIDDIKRIYILSPEDELIRIYNNLGNKQFQVIDTDIINDILKGKAKEIDKFKVLGISEESRMLIENGL
ncbi:MAG: hypothetical protein ACYC0N_00510 [Carboxydocellales bacterium]